MAYDDTPRLSDTPLSLDELTHATERPDCGALAIFTGNVRDHHDGKSVARLIYTAHAPVAEKMIRAIEQEVLDAHDIAECLVVHRVGELEIGDAAIVAVVRAAHRGAAFDALRAVVDAVKHRVPIWKEEFYIDGTSVFVEGCSLVEAESSS